MTEIDFYEAVHAVYEDLMESIALHKVMILADRMHFIDPESHRHTTMMITPKPAKEKAK